MSLNGPLNQGYENDTYYPSMQAPDFLVIPQPVSQTKSHPYAMDDTAEMTQNCAIF